MAPPRGAGLSVPLSGELGCTVGLLVRGRGQARGRWGLSKGNCATAPEAEVQDEGVRGAGLSRGPSPWARTAVPCGCVSVLTFPSYGDSTHGGSGHPRGLPLTHSPLQRQAQQRRPRGHQGQGWSPRPAHGALLEGSTCPLGRCAPRVGEPGSTSCPAVEGSTGLTPHTHRGTKEEEEAAFPDSTEEAGRGSEAV